MIFPEINQKSKKGKNLSESPNRINYIQENKLYLKRMSQKYHQIEKIYENKLVDEFKKKKSADSKSIPKSIKVNYSMKNDKIGNSKIFYNTTIQSVSETYDKAMQEKKKNSFLTKSLNEYYNSVKLIFKPKELYKFYY